MKKKKYLLILMEIIICAGCLLGCYQSVRSYRSAVKKNWGIELPGYGAKEVFAYSQPSPHGDGIRYHVIDYPVGNESKKMQNTVFTIEKIFKGSSQPTYQQIEYVNQLLQKVDISEELIPDFSRCRLISEKSDDGSELFMFYDSETGKMYLVESFI